MNHIPRQKEDPLPHLSTEEKADLRAKIVSFMNTHPVVKEEIQIPVSFFSWLAPVRFYSAIYSRQLMSVSFVALFLFIGVGISFAAERSLPGDTLYAIKTKVNEPISGFFAIHAKDKAQFETELASRRLEEAERLAKKGTLDEVTLARIETRFERHADEVDKEVKTLEAEDDKEGATLISTSFTTRLEAHKTVLVGVSSLHDRVDARIKRYKPEMKVATTLTATSSIKEASVYVAPKIKATTSIAITASTTASTSIATSVEVEKEVDVVKETILPKTETKVKEEKKETPPAQEVIKEVKEIVKPILGI